MWRFPTDPITHACWAGITGYFIGLAMRRRNLGHRKWYATCWVGLAIATVLHGLNDWDALDGRWAWIVIAVVSALLFLTYAKADAPAPVASTESGGQTPPAASTAAAPAPSRSGQSEP